MTEFLIYDGKVAVLIAMFYMFYRLMLARETFHRVNRVVLLATAVASFVLPLCVITMHETVVMDSPETLDMVDMAAIPDLPSATKDAPVAALWPAILSTLFIIGMLVTLGHTLLSIGKVWLLIRRSERHPQPDGTTICVTGNAELAPFSWMHYIVMNRSDYELHDAAILAHERGHIRLRHSWDVLLVDTLTALQWFNPAMWMLRTDLRAIHEYEADGAVLSQGINARQYQYLLITKAASIGGYSIANGISHSTLKNRINMMLHKKSSSSHLLKLLALVPIVGITLAMNAKTVTDVVYSSETPAAESMTAEAMTDNQKINFRVAFMPENAPIEGVPVEVITNGKVTERSETVEKGEISLQAPLGATVRFTLIDKVKEVKVTNELLAKAAKGIITVGFGKDNAEIVEVSDATPFLAEGTVYDAEQQTPVIGAVVKNTRTQKGVVTDKEGHFSIEAIMGDQIVVSYAGFESSAIGVSKTFSGTGLNKMIIPLRRVDSTRPYDVVDEMPQFPGGPGKLFEYITQNLRYPKEAEDKGLQGRVITTFVVETDGGISNVQVVKSVEPTLDAEAVRVVRAMPKWIPGKQGSELARVKYTIPVTFKLDNGPAIPSTNETATNAIAETVVMGHQEKANSKPQPLYVLNGSTVEYDQIEKLDPKNIEHIDVLKGESATKVYGAKAEHGAILITTKKE